MYNVTPVHLPGVNLSIPYFSSLAGAMMMHKMVMMRMLVAGHEDAVQEMVWLLMSLILCLNVEDILLLISSHHPQPLPPQLRPPHPYPLHPQDFCVIGSN